MRKTVSRVMLSALLLVVPLFHVSSLPLAAQTTWFVDDDAPNDPGPGDPAVSDPLEDGTIDHPYDAIQEGIIAAMRGSTVLVADGLYRGFGNRDIGFLGKKITVPSVNGPENCTVDCEGVPGIDRCGFEFVAGEGPLSTLQGFTITGASGDDCQG